MTDKLPNLTPQESRTLCSLCAWRLECKKKFSFEQGDATRCADYSEDVTLKKKDCDD